MLYQTFLSFYNEQQQQQQRQIEKANITKLANYIGDSVNSPWLITPEEFSITQSIKFDEALTTIAFFTDESNNQKSLVSAYPYFECLDSNCSHLNLLSNTFNPENNTITCEECDRDYDIELYKEHVLFYFRLNKKLIDMLENKRDTNTLISPKTSVAILSESTAGLKSYSPTSKGLEVGEMSEIEPLTKNDLQNNPSTVNLEKVESKSIKTVSPKLSLINPFSKLSASSRGEY